MKFEEELPIGYVEPINGQVVKYPWVKLDGQILDCKDSPLNGTKLPNTHGFKMLICTEYKPIKINYLSVN